MAIDFYIKTQVFVLAAKDMKRDKSQDYCRGFDDGAELIAKYVKELLDCKSYLPTESGEEPYRKI